MIDFGYVKFFDEFLETEKEDYEKKYKKAYNALNKFLKKSLTFLAENFNNEIEFKFENISDYMLKTNFKNFSNSVIKINYIAPENLIHNAKNTSAYKKLKDKFIEDTNKILLPNEVIKFLQSELGKEVLNCKTTAKNNVLLVKIYDFRFYILVDFNIENSFVLFKRNYNINQLKFSENFAKKEKETNGNFSKVIRFFKNIEVELAINNLLTNILINKIYLYENILFNVPSKLFCEEFTYLNYLNAITYLSNTNPENFKTMDEQDFSSVQNLKDFDLFIVNNKVFLNNINYILQGE